MYKPWPQPITRRCRAPPRTPTSTLGGGHAAAMQGTHARATIRGSHRAAARDCARRIGPVHAQARAWRATHTRSRTSSSKGAPVIAATLSLNARCPSSPGGRHTCGERARRRGRKTLGIVLLRRTRCVRARTHAGRAAGGARCLAPGARCRQGGWTPPPLRPQGRRAHCPRYRCRRCQRRPWPRRRPRRPRRQSGWRCWPSQGWCSWCRWPHPATLHRLPPPLPRPQLLHCVCRSRRPARPQQRRGRAARQTTRRAAPRRRSGSGCLPAA